MILRSWGIRSATVGFVTIALVAGGVLGVSRAFFSATPAPAPVYSVMQAVSLDLASGGTIRAGRVISVRGALVSYSVSYGGTGEPSWTMTPTPVLIDASVDLMKVARLNGATTLIVHPTPRVMTGLDGQWAALTRVWNRLVRSAVPTTPAGSQAPSVTHVAVYTVRLLGRVPCAPRLASPCAGITLYQ